MAQVNYYLDNRKTPKGKESPIMMVVRHGETTAMIRTGISATRAEFVDGAFVGCNAFLPGLNFASEVDEVVNHELLMHKGAKEMLDAANGKGTYNDFCRWVYNNTMNAKEQEEFSKYAKEEGAGDIEAAAGDEFLAANAERYNVFDRKSFWGKIADKIRDILGMETYDDSFGQLLVDSYRNQVIRADIKQAYAEAAKAGEFAKEDKEDVAAEKDVPSTLSEIPKEWLDGTIQGRLAEIVNSIDELSDEDFTRYIRSVIRDCRLMFSV